MQRYSEKRQAILNCLRATRSHPDAETVYATLKPGYPDLSLATVYRNLADLKAAGLIRSVGHAAGREHFDADLAPHSHAICQNCGAIVDLPASLFSSAEETSLWLEKAKTASGYTLSEASLSFSGLCPRCAGTHT